MVGGEGGRAVGERGSESIVWIIEGFGGGVVCEGVDEYLVV